MSATKPRRKSDVAIQELGEDVLLYRAENQAIHVLNTTAQRIWELCDGEHTEEDIAQALRTHFAVPTGHDVAGDIRLTLGRFAEQGLLWDESPN